MSDIIVARPAGFSGNRRNVASEAYTFITSIDTSRKYRPGGTFSNSKSKNLSAIQINTSPGRMMLPKCRGQGKSAKIFLTNDSSCRWIYEIH